MTDAKVQLLPEVLLREGWGKAGLREMLERILRASNASPTECGLRLPLKVVQQSLLKIFQVSEDGSQAQKLSTLRLDSSFLRNAVTLSCSPAPTTQVLRLLGPSTDADSRLAGQHAQCTEQARSRRPQAKDSSSVKRLS